jgi:DNA invertase Pin-like site-specific DNA recombinase
MKNTRKRAALYVRVSTDEQTSKNQEADLRELAKRKGLTVVKTYADNGVSGSRSEKERPQLLAMFQAAHRREFDMLLFWALDRLSREGVYAVHGYLQRLVQAGVGYQSHQEPWLNSEDPNAELLLSPFAWVSKQANVRLIERTKAGMRRAAAEGTRLGRPPLSPETVEKVTSALQEGKGIRETARLYGIGSASVLRIKARTMPRRVKARRRTRRRDRQKVV